MKLDSLMMAREGRCVDCLVSKEKKKGKQECKLVLRETHLGGVSKLIQLPDFVRVVRARSTASLFGS